MLAFLTAADSFPSTQITALAVGPRHAALGSRLGAVFVAEHGATRRWLCDFKACLARCHRGVFMIYINCLCEPLSLPFAWLGKPARGESGPAARRQCVSAVRMRPGRSPRTTPASRRWASTRRAASAVRGTAASPCGRWAPRF